MDTVSVTTVWDFAGRYRGQGAIVSHDALSVRVEDFIPP
jgi:hypothetical protein